MDLLHVYFTYYTLSPVAVLFTNFYRSISLVNFDSVIVSVSERTDQDASICDPACVYGFCIEAYVIRQCDW